MDSQIEKSAKKQIKDIFTDDGESVFRKMERELVKCLSLLDGLVISTGGGIVLKPVNIKDLRKNGKIVFLKCGRSPRGIEKNIRQKEKTLCRLRSLR